MLERDQDRDTTKKLAFSITVSQSDCFISQNERFWLVIHVWELRRALRDRLTRWLLLAKLANQIRVCCTYFISSFINLCVRYFVKSLE